VKSQTAVSRTVVFVLSFCLAAFASSHGRDKKEQAKVAPTTVDSGSFGVMVKGQRVATETFTIQQQNGVSIIKSQLKQTVGADPVSEKSDLEITPTGELLRYEWSEVPGGSLVVLPNNDFDRKDHPSQLRQDRGAAFPDAQHLRNSRQQLLRAPRSSALALSCGRLQT